jgi:hypothetical protein
VYPPWAVVAPAPVPRPTAARAAHMTETVANRLNLFMRLSRSPNVRYRSQQRAYAAIMWARGLILAGLCAAAIASTPAAFAEPAPSPNTDANGVPTNQSGGPVTTINGVPCTAGHYGTCFSFAQNQPGRESPRVTVGGSPTVRR